MYTYKSNIGLEILTYSQLDESYKNDLQNESICTVSPIYAHGHAV